MPAGILGKATGLLMLGSFGVFPVSVALAAFFTRSLGPAPFFVFAAATLTVAILAGLTQREWRDFGMSQAANTTKDSETTPPSAPDIERQTA